MLLSYIWSQLFISGCLIAIVGYYLQWQATLSIVSVFEELHNLTKVMCNLTVPITNKTSIIGIDVGIDNYVPLTTYWSYCLYFSILISILLLIDRIPSSWKTLRLGNRVITSRHTNAVSLVFNETLAYLTSIPNLVTLTIGLLQAYSTCEASQVDYPIFANLAIYLACLFSDKSTSQMVSNGLGVILGIGLVTRIIGFRFWVLKGNFVNLVVSVICLLFAVYQELVVHRLSSEMDERRNGNMVRRLDLETGQVELVRAEYLRLGDTVILREGEITPATLCVDRLRCIRDTLDMDYVIGTYYDRVTSGEDVSRKFVKGDTLLADRMLTRPDLEITAHITKYIETDCQGQRGDTVPHFLDRVRCVADLVGLILLLAVSLSVSASALAKTFETEPLNSLNEVATHILAAAISSNVLIPSMRMTLLYNVYNLVVSQLYSNIRTTNYSSIPKLSGLDRIIFDKTGTLTEECLEVANFHSYSVVDTPVDTARNSLAKLVSETGWTPEEVRFALIIANNESNINNKSDKVWGTSPEECEILKYWRHYPLQLVNPLKESGKLTFSLVENGPPRTLHIIERLPYKFGRGKLALIEIHPAKSSKVIKLQVRQDGSSHISEVVSEPAKEWSECCEREDPRRSMSIAYCLADKEENDPWELLGIYSFENPLRPGIPHLMEFVTRESLTPYILTGDGCEAAEEVSRRAGFPKGLVRLEGPSETIENIIADLSPKLDEVTLMISGLDLSDWLDKSPEEATVFLDRDRRPKVIYRASRSVKDQVTKVISKGIYMGDAANDALAIKNSQVGIALAHGAEVCRLEASIIMKSPTDLIGLLTKNGYRDMLLAGGERLLEDVCWMGGLTAGCLVIGLHRHGFQFLQNSPLYLETWKPLPMLVVSSFQYTISALAYASADCEGASHCWRCLASSCARWHIVGLLFGMLLGWVIKNWVPSANYSYLVLHALDITVLTKHSWHCWYPKQPRLAKRRGGGLLGNQVFSDTSERIGFILCILDSIPARCLLYGIFNLLGEGYF